MGFEIRCRLGHTDKDVFRRDLRVLTVERKTRVTD